MKASSFSAFRLFFLSFLLFLFLFCLPSCGSSLPKEPEDIAHRLTLDFPALPVCRVYAGRCPPGDPAHLSAEAFSLLYTGQSDLTDAISLCDNFYIMLSVPPGGFELHILCAKNSEAIGSLRALAEARADYLNRCREQRKEADDTFFTFSTAAVYVRGDVVILAVTDCQDLILSSLSGH